MNSIKRSLSPAVLLMLAPGIVAEAAPKPNVLFILTDDQGFGDLSLTGNPVLATPNIDTFAGESLWLNHFYVSSVCSPTRASLLTGRYHLRTGVTDVTRRKEVMNPSETTLGELFLQNGYRTGYFGKWHNGSVYPETPDGQGFAEFTGFPYGHTTRYFDPVLEHNGQPVQKTGYITDVLTDEALGFIGTAAHPEKPFFCFLSYNAPHTPVMAPQELFQKYKQLDPGLTDQSAGIYAMCESLDQNIGRLLSELEKRGLKENTLVVFMTDNGPIRGRYNQSLKGVKAQSHEGGVRVPCFWRWPARWQTPGMIQPRLAHIDVLPTLVELFGLDGAQTLDLDGQSFAALLDNPGADWPNRHLYTFHFGSPDVIRRAGAVRTDRWLAVSLSGKWELYDLLADPLQQTDLASASLEVLAFLRTEFEAKLASIEPEMQPGGIPVPVGNPVRPKTLLEAHDAVLNGSGIAYSYPAGFAHHWITGWTDTAAYPEWTIHVEQAGSYTVVLQYGLSPENTNVHLRVCSESGEIQTVLDVPYVPPVIPQPFILPDEAVKYETRVWTNRTVGTLHLESGRQTLRIRADKIPGKQAMDLKAVELIAVQ